MYSADDHRGFEVYLSKDEPKGAKFNEYNVKHYTNEKGVSVTECWLECEDDARFGVEVKRHETPVDIVDDCEWKISVRADSKPLVSATMVHLQTSVSRRSRVYSDPDEPGMEKTGFFKFVVPATTSDQEAIHADLAVIRSLGKIEVTLQPGRTYLAQAVDLRSGAFTAPSTGVLEETQAKLSRAVSCEYSAARPIKQASGPIRTFTPLGDTWHIFVFKYRHRAVLESLGVIDVKPNATSASPFQAASSSSSGSRTSQQHAEEMSRKRKLDQIKIKREDGGSDDENDPVRQAEREIKYFEAQLRRARTRVKSLAGAKEAEIVDISSDNDE